jgi:hypothetical protein
MNASLFIATPLHDARMHSVYTHGLLSAWACGLAQRWSTCNGTGLMRQRDRLVSDFLESDCSHLLFVDSDIAWSPDQALKLLATGEEFVGGAYCKKAPGNFLAARLTGGRKGELLEADHVATGFLLVARAAIERMVEAFRADTYESGGKSFVALFQQNIHEGTEDLAFCRKWREIGGQVWLHSGVVLPHFDGNTPYIADLTELRKPYEAELRAVA